MLTLFRYECKASLKALLIWALAVGGMGLICILLFKSMESNMADMADSFASMGAFSDAFGMNTLSIATVTGYFATEVGTIHALGGGLFAASIATVVLSKEEDGHTAEFTFTFPVSRGKVITVKFLSVMLNLLVFTLICGILYLVGFAIIGDADLGKEFYTFMAAQFMMMIEIASIGFLISSISKKNRLGVGIAVAMICYLYDIMARAVPAMKDYKIFSPYAYANAVDIFSHSGNLKEALFLGIGVSIVLIVVAAFIYNKRDLAS